MQSEWRWFRASLVESLVHPGQFARTLPREHYGLASVLVALIAGAALSVTVDALVILSKQADPLAFAPRVLADAFLLGARLAIVTALIALLTLGAGRTIGRAIPLDQSFTALAFASTPLLLAPVAALLVLVAGELPGEPRAALLVAALAFALVLVLRLVGGVTLNLAALAGRAAVPLAAVAVVSGALVLQDQVGRAFFTALTYAPQLLPPPAAQPMAGREVRVEGMRLRLTDAWEAATRGVPGVLAEYDLPDARLTIRSTSVSILTTADSFATNVVANTKRDFTRIDRSERRLVRIDGVAAIDDRWHGSVREQRLVERLFTFVRGARGYTLEFEFFAPADEDAAQDLAARIAASLTLH